MLQLTFNPGLTLTGFRTTRPGLSNKKSREVENVSVIEKCGKWQRLRNDHRIVVSRETVRLVLRIIDPDGVAQRLSR